LTEDNFDRIAAIKALKKKEGSDTSNQLSENLKE